MVRVLIADDHWIFREGLRHFLEAIPDIVITGEARSGAEAVALTRDLLPDVLLLDLDLPDYSGLEVLQRVADIDTVRTILLTARVELEQLVDALKFGARGVVMKGAESDELARAIFFVVEGQFWVSRPRLSEVIQKMRADYGGAPVPDVPDRPRKIDFAGAVETDAGKRQFGLTDREMQVVQAIADGYSNKEIAAGLRISERTVKHHLEHIFDKVGAFNRLELAMFAINHSIVAETASPARGGRFR